MGFDPKGSPTLGLDDCKVGAWASTGTYGTLVDVPSVQLMDTTMKVVNAQLEGDDQITANSSKIVGATCKIRFGSLSLAALVVMLGVSKVNSGTTPNAQDAITLVGGTQLPNFGLCGRAKASQGGGDLHVFLPKCQIMEDVNLGSLEYGKFTITELTVYAVNDETYDLLNFVEHETVTSITMPPTGIS